MALSKEDRISFSRQIVGADASKAIIESSKQKLLAEKAKAYDLDQANKRLLDSKSSLIDPYQNELGRYNGIFRISLTETDINNSANFVLGNYLYPNDSNNIPPSLAPSLWTKSKPYARTAAVGKNLLEAYPASVSAEQSKITTILSTINTIETSYTLIQRVTGQICVPGTVTPPVPDSIQTYTALVNNYNTLLSAINDLKTYVLATQPLILTADSNSARQTDNNTAISDINTIVSAINVWLALTAFKTSHGQTTCAGFNSYNPALLGATRLQSGNLTTLKTAITARQTFVGTRVTQLGTNLGSITQDISTAEATGTGLYFERWNLLQLRLNLFGGSLTALNGFDRTIAAQDSQQAQVDLSKNTYQTFLLVSAFSAPSNGTKVLHLKSAAGLSAGDNVYVVSETQEEISRTIQSVEGNRVTVGVEVPAKYRPEEGARLYKDIS